MRAWCLLFLATSLGAQTALATLQAEAERNNPQVRAAALAWQSAQEAVAPAGALPDPQAMLQQVSVGSPVPFAGYQSSDFAYIGVGVSQELPYPGKLKLRKAVAGSAAAAAEAQLQAVRRQVAQQVAAAYIQVAYLAQAEVLLGEQRARLGEAEQLAELHYRTAAGSQAEVLAAQLESTRLLQQAAVLRLQQGTAQTGLRTLLGRASTAPPVEAAPLSRSPVPPDDAGLQAALAGADPGLVQRRAELTGARQAEDLARLNFKPDFNFQYMYQRTGPGFRDYYQWTLGMTLPFFHRGTRQQPLLRQAAADAAKAQLDYQAAQLQQLGALTDWLLMAHSDEQVLDLDQDGLLPQARASWSAALAAYRDGQGELTRVLAAAGAVLELEQEYWHTLAEHETALTQVAALTGVAYGR